MKAQGGLGGKFPVKVAVAANPYSGQGVAAAQRNGAKIAIGHLSLARIHFGSRRQSSTAFTRAVSFSTA